MRRLDPLFLLLLFQLYIHDTWAVTVPEPLKTGRRCKTPTLKIVESRPKDVFVCNGDDQGWTRYSSCYDQCLHDDTRGMACVFDFLTLRSCWLAHGSVGKGKDANDEFPVTEKETADEDEDCGSVVDGLLVREDHFSVCHNGTALNDSDSPCPARQPCVLLAEDWTLRCHDNVNPVFGLLCGILDSRGAGKSGPSPVQALVTALSAPRPQPDGQLHRSPYIGEMVRNVLVTVWQIEDERNKLPGGLSEVKADVQDHYAFENDLVKNAYRTSGFKDGAGGSPRGPLRYRRSVKESGKEGQPAKYRRYADVKDEAGKTTHAPEDATVMPENETAKRPRTLTSTHPPMADEPAKNLGHAAVSKKHSSLLSELQKMTEKRNKTGIQNHGNKIKVHKANVSSTTQKTANVSSPARKTDDKNATSSRITLQVEAEKQVHSTPSPPTSPERLMTSLLLKLRTLFDPKRGDNTEGITTNGTKNSPSNVATATTAKQNPNEDDPILSNILNVTDDLFRVLFQLEPPQTPTEELSSGAGRENADDPHRGGKNADGLASATPSKRPPSSGQVDFEFSFVIEGNPRRNKSWSEKEETAVSFKAKDSSSKRNSTGRGSLPQRGKHGHVEAPPFLLPPFLPMFGFPPFPAPSLVQKLRQRPSSQHRPFDWGRPLQNDPPQLKHKAAPNNDSRGIPSPVRKPGQIGNMKKIGPTSVSFFVAIPKRPVVRWNTSGSPKKRPAFISFSETHWSVGPKHPGSGGHGREKEGKTEKKPGNVKVPPFPSFPPLIPGFWLPSDLHGKVPPHLGRLNGENEFNNHGNPFPGPHSGPKPHFVQSMSDMNKNTGPEIVRSMPPFFAPHMVPKIDMNKNSGPEIVRSMPPFFAPHMVSKIDMNKNTGPEIVRSMSPFFAPHMVPKIDMNKNTGPEIVRSMPPFFAPHMVPKIDMNKNTGPEIVRPMPPFFAPHMVPKIDMNKNTGPEIVRSMPPFFSPHMVSKIDMNKNSGPEIVRSMPPFFAPHMVPKIDMNKNTGPEIVRSMPPFFAPHMVPKIDMNKNTGPEIVRSMPPFFAPPLVSKIDMNKNTGPEIVRSMPPKSAPPSVSKIDMSKNSGPEIVRSMPPKSAPHMVPKIDMNKNSGPEIVRSMPPKSAPPSVSKSDMNKNSGPEIVRSMPPNSAPPSVSKSDMNKNTGIDRSMPPFFAPPPVSVPAKKITKAEDKNILAGAKPLKSKSGIHLSIKKRPGIVEEHVRNIELKPLKKEVEHKTQTNVDKSPDKVVMDKSPDNVVMDKFPNKVVMDKSPDKVVMDKFPNKVVMDKFPNKVVMDKFPDKVVMDKSPDKVVMDKFPDKVVMDKFPYVISQYKTLEKKNDAMKLMQTHSTGKEKKQKAKRLNGKESIETLNPIDNQRKTGKFVLKEAKASNDINHSDVSIDTRLPFIVDSQKDGRPASIIPNKEPSKGDDIEARVQIIQTEPREIIIVNEREDEMESYKAESSDQKLRAKTGADAPGKQKISDDKHNPELDEKAASIKKKKINQDDLKAAPKKNQVKVDDRKDPEGGIPGTDRATDMLSSKEETKEHVSVENAGDQRGKLASPSPLPPPHGQPDPRPPLSSAKPKAVRRRSVHPPHAHHNVGGHGLSD